MVHGNKVLKIREPLQDVFWESYNYGKWLKRDSVVGFEYGGGPPDKKYVWSLEATNLQEIDSALASRKEHKPA